MSGSYILTGDWQARSSNLETIRLAIERENAVMREYGADFVIDLGDLKDPYNPLDARLAMVMQDRFLHKQHFVVKGNHDRLSQNDNDLTWFPLVGGVENFVLRAARIEKPDVIFYVLPYSNNGDELRKVANDLAAMARTDRAQEPKGSKREFVLLFHCDVREADYGSGRLNIDSIGMGDLQFDAYDYAFGGHVHKPQELVPSMAYYVGSPFCQDWGEANQVKRFLVYTPGKGVKSVPVGLPGFYDWDVAKTLSVESLAGSTVRFHIRAKDGAHYRALEVKRREQFAGKYPNTMLHCVPEYEQTEIADYTFTQGNDETKVREFIRQTKDDDKALADYVVKTLERATTVRTLNTEGLRFVAARGHNYTSFEDVRFDYRKRGVVVINGKNLDWPGRSNAAGKTNIQDLVKVGMFGERDKGKEERADSWASETLAGTAWLETIFDTAAGDRVKIKRSRNPTSIQMFVNGEDKSSGLTGREKNGGTQGLIVEYSGYDLRMLTNAVYIDQERAHKFLTGTPKEKSELLYKFQGLERFQTARELVAAEVKTQKELATRLDRECVAAKATHEAAVLTHQDAHAVLESAIAETAATAKALELRSNAVDEYMPTYDKAVLAHKRITIKLQELNRQAGDNAALLGAARNTVELHTASIERSKKARVAAKIELATRQSALSVAQDGYNKAVESLAVLREQVTAATDALNAGEREKAVTIAQLGACRTEIKALGTGRCGACDRPFDNEKIVARRKRELAAQETEWLESLASSDKAINISQATISNNTIQIKKFEATISTYESLQRHVQNATTALESVGIGVDVDTLTAEIADAQENLSLCRDRGNALNLEIEQAQELLPTYQEQLTIYTRLTAAKDVEVGQLEDGRVRERAAQARYDRAASDKVTVKATVERLTGEYDAAQSQLSLLTRAVECLDRTGIPAYLCAMLCPMLTKAAEEYAKLFADDALQIVFEFVDGEFDSKIINGQGSSTMEGLSTGEKATASLITAFALRSAAPKTNLLVLDEPGRGLDELGQRKFAEALATLKDSFETILVSTHDIAFADSLSADVTLTVVKENRISRIEQ